MNGSLERTVTLSPICEGQDQPDVIISENTVRLTTNSLTHKQMQELIGEYNLYVLACTHFGGLGR